MSPGLGVCWGEGLAVVVGLQFGAVISHDSPGLRLMDLSRDAAWS